MVMFPQPQDRLGQGYPQPCLHTEEVAFTPDTSWVNSKDHFYLFVPISLLSGNQRVHIFSLLH